MRLQRQRYHHVVAGVPKYLQTAVDIPSPEKEENWAELSSFPGWLRSDI